VRKEAGYEKAKFSAQYLQSTSMPIFEEESLVGVELTKRIYEECLKKLQDAKKT
jgi:hypothetical protein